MPVINTTAIALGNGSTAIGGTGQDTTFTFSGAYTTGDKYTVVLTDSATGVQYQVGAGFVTGTVPVFTTTFQNKLYTLAGATAYFSALGSATVWNNPSATGNGFVSMSNYYYTPEPLVSMAVYQGRLAFFSRSTTQIWTVNANPALWAQNQVLQNIGTFAPLSVQSYGDLDVYFLSDTGVRSLRVRDSSNNAFVDDIGSPVDQLIQAQLSTLTATELASCSAVIEPTSNRYMVFVPNHAANPTVGQYYVLSYFRASKVAAWSTYQPTWSNAGAQTYFTPQNHVILKGQVFTRDTIALYKYAALSNTYDNCVATITSPYHDAKKPINNKELQAVDMVAQGDAVTLPSDKCGWKVQVGMDPVSNTFSQVLNFQAPPTSGNQATVDAGLFPTGGLRGTHLAFQAITQGTGSATLSEIVFKYQDSGEKT